jgi:hypothetical protein
MADQWLPGATRVLGISAGPYIAGAGPKIVHHTTEGGSATGAIGAFHATGSWPTMTAEWTGSRLRVFQHVPLNMSARALEHPAGTPETNRAGCAQIEHVGFTDDSARRRAGATASLLVDNWPVERWHAIAELCRLIEARTGCPARSAVPSLWWRKPQRLTGSEFVKAMGHLAHIHAAGNHHLDCGIHFRIDIVTDAKAAASAQRTLVEGVNGPDVLAFQLAVRLHAARCGRPDRMPVADAICGPQTMTDGAFVAFLLGLGRSQDALVAHGVSVATQQRVRDPKRRNATQVKRAAQRRTLLCKGA